MSVEQELISVTGFKPRKDYDNRQDYLAALVRAVDGLGNSEFDDLSNEAADWFNKSVRALKAKKELPDFGVAAIEEEMKQDPELEPVEAEAEEKPAPKAKVERRKKGQAPKKLEHAKIEEPAEDATTIKLDEFGVAVGSKNHAAISMLKKGCRMSDVTESIGGTYYNLIHRLQKQGHSVEKGANGFIKLVHSSNTSKE